MIQAHYMLLRDAMTSLAFRLSANLDPEERLEEAALWKAMHDVYGEAIVPLSEGSQGDPQVPTFGRELKNPFNRGHNPVPDGTPYWKDPAFLKHCGRTFVVCDFKKAPDHIDALHQQGHDAFVKSTRSKHAVFRVEVGQTMAEAMGDLIYSFIDGGPSLMVQQFCRIQHEHRFFVIDRKIVTHSPTQWSLTPLDFPLPLGTTYNQNTDSTPIQRPDVIDALMKKAEQVASTMIDVDVSIDCALINGSPAVIEMHPTRLGQLGLYACDVRALAEASRAIVSRLNLKAHRQMVSSNYILEDEEEFMDTPFKL